MAELTDVDRLADIWESSPDTRNDVQSLYPGLAHAIERVIDPELRAEPSTSRRPTVADDRCDHAVETVARRVLVTVARRALDDSGRLREEWPELGEHDWRAVLHAVAFNCDQLDPGDTYVYEPAYQYLAARAEGATP